ncbi:MAG: hypothetical protein K2L46_09100, partial [Paramuribaculum sp.]|nr:hypothetical protein [Paramuribaculum sp.]
MKKILMYLVCLFAAMNAMADRTFSFGQISTYSPQAGLVSGGGAVISLTIGDGYIIHPMYGKMYQGQTNRDGSAAYYPSGFSGPPMAMLQGILISADLQRMEEHLTSTYAGMTVQMINTYTNAGEDGGRYADSWSNAVAVSNDRSLDREIRRESRSRSGSCHRCGGSGIDPSCVDLSLPTHKTGSSKIPAYTKCPYCKDTKSYDHWHWKCI